MPSIDHAFREPAYIPSLPSRSLALRNPVLRRIQGLEFRLVGGKAANAGIQFRTERIPDHHEVIPQTGKICLQIHGGPPAEAWYRNVRIRRLERKRH